MHTQPCRPPTLLVCPDPLPEWTRPSAALTSMGAALLAGHVAVLPSCARALDLAGAATPLAG